MKYQIISHKNFCLKIILRQAFIKEEKILYSAGLHLLIKMLYYNTGLKTCNRDRG